MEESKKIALMDDELEAVAGGAGSATGYNVGERVCVQNQAGALCPKCGAKLDGAMATVMDCTTNSRGAYQCMVRFDCCGYDRNYISGALRKV